MNEASCSFIHKCASCNFPKGPVDPRLAQNMGFITAVGAFCSQLLGILDELGFCLKSQPCQLWHSAVWHHFSRCLGWTRAGGCWEEWGDEMLKHSTPGWVCNVIPVSQLIKHLVKALEDGDGLVCLSSSLNKEEVEMGRDAVLLRLVHESFLMTTVVFRTLICGFVVALLDWTWFLIVSCISTSLAVQDLQGRHCGFVQVP